MTAEYTPPGWPHGLVLDRAGTPIVNGTPFIRPGTEAIVANGGPLSSVILWCWWTALDERLKLPAPEIARRMYPWLVAVGWTPPSYEPAGAEWADG